MYIFIGLAGAILVITTFYLIRNANQRHVAEELVAQAINRSEKRMIERSFSDTCPLPALDLDISVAEELTDNAFDLHFSKQ